MDWKKVLGSVAPALATALGGPLAGMATAAVSDALLGKPDGSEAEMAVALKAGGAEALLKLKEADQKFALDMRRIGVDLEKIAQEDRSSARDREVKTGDKATPRMLATVIVGGFLLTVWYVLSGQVDGLKDPVAAGLIGTLIGYVSAKADQVVSYYFGSSAGSQEKNQLLAKK